MDCPGEQAEAGVEEHSVDTVSVHIWNTLVRVEPTGLAVFVGERVGGNNALARADAADPPDADPAVADHILSHDEALFAVVGLHNAGRPIAKIGIDVVVPKIKRLKDMAIGVDYIVRAG